MWEGKESREEGKWKGIEAGRVRRRCSGKGERVRRGEEEESEGGRRKSREEGEWEGE